MCGVGRKSCTFLRRPRDKGVRSGPQALIAPLSAPVPVRSDTGWDAPFPERESGCAESPGSDADRAPNPAARPTPLVVVHPGRATASCTFICTPRRTRGDGAIDAAPTSEPSFPQSDSPNPRHRRERDVGNKQIRTATASGGQRGPLVGASLVRGAERHTDISAHRHTATPADTGTPGHRDTGTPGHRDTGTPGHRDTGTPGQGLPAGTPPLHAPACTTLAAQQPHQ